MMKEEKVTKYILQWLINNGWEIICYDFPQSGTGHFLHPNGSTSKNQDSINPDIVAVKNNTCVFFENKDRFYYPDYEKINSLIVNNDYSDAINDLLNRHRVTEYFYGIGFPTSAHSTKAIAAENLVDFVIGVEENGDISKLYLREGYDFFTNA